MRDYKACIQNLNTFSKNANIFVLIHKMDKISDNEKEKVYFWLRIIVNVISRSLKIRREKLLKLPLLSEWNLKKFSLLLFGMILYTRYRDVKRIFSVNIIKGMVSNCSIVDPQYANYQGYIETILWYLWLWWSKNRKDLWE